MKAIALSTTLLLALGSHALAQTGTGNTWAGFGPDRANGAVVNITRRHLTNQYAQGIAVDRQQRLLVLNEWDEQADIDTDCAVTRYINRARGLDMDYTGPEELEGTRHIAMNMGGTNVDTCSSIASDNLNRAVVVGGGDYGDGASGFVVRLSANGDFDSTFSSDGKFALHSVIYFTGTSTRLNHVLVQPNNRVLACGHVLRGSDRNMLAVRFTTSGALDSSFGGNGFVEIDFDGGGSDDDSCARLALLPDGDIVLGGTASDASGDKVYAFARLNSNGSLDSGFSLDGKLRLGTGTALAATPSLSDLIHDPVRNRYLVGCNLTYTAGSLRSGCIMAIRDNGTLDTSFDGDGRLFLRFSSYGLGTPRETGGTRVTRLLRRDDGAIYVLGTHDNSTADAAVHGDTDIVSMRVEANGSVVVSPGGSNTYAGSGIQFHSFPQVRQSYNGSYSAGIAYDELADEKLVDATWYRGNLLLLADRTRYRDRLFDHDGDGILDEPGPSAPLVASITSEQLFGADFDFDGIDLARPAIVPVIAVPFGFGNYCSVSNPSAPSNYGLLAQGVGSDPCQQFLDGNPNLVIERAGLYSLSGLNWVIGTCSGGFVTLRPGNGSTPFNLAFNDTVGRSGCVFTGAPDAMPIFSRPYSGSASGVGSAQSFNHDPYGIPIDVSEFGQVPGFYDACSIDNHGNQHSTGDPSVPDACTPTDGVDEAASDIPVTSSRMVTSVANGWVIMAVPRHIPIFAPGGMDPWQREIFVRHQVGTGRYAEIFTAYYAHTQDTAVRHGQAVNTGTVLGRVGTTGSSGGEHLHIAVHRHRNLSWRKSFEFDFSGGGRWDRDGRASAIDAWGWAPPDPPFAPDPWAWRFRNAVPDKPELDNSGSFSTRLWIGGQAPPLD